MSTPSSLSCVVPVYDEVESLRAFHASLCAALDLLERGELGRTRLSGDIVYVDDGSTDGSTELLGEIQAEAPERVHVVVLRRNFGKSGALAAGFEAASGDLIATLDADGQDVPSEIGKLVDRLVGAEVDLVGGWRAARFDRSVKRRTSQMYNAVTRAVTGLDLHDFNTGFKVMRREVVEELPLYGEFHRFVPVLAYDLGFRVDEVAVDHRPREAGRSKYLSLTRFPKTMLDLLTVLFLTRFADRPLYLFGGVGTVFSLLGVVILAYLSYLRLVLDEGIGTRPLLLFGILLLLVGVQLIGTGFIGDVLRHTAARHQRPFRVRRTLGAGPTSSAHAASSERAASGPAAPNHAASDEESGAAT